VSPLESVTSSPGKKVYNRQSLSGRTPGPENSKEKVAFRPETAKRGRRNSKNFPVGGGNSKLPAGKGRQFGCYQRVGQSRIWRSLCFVKKRSTR